MTAGVVIVTAAAVVENVTKTVFHSGNNNRRDRLSRPVRTIRNFPFGSDGLPPPRQSPSVLSVHQIVSVHARIASSCTYYACAHNITNVLSNARYRCVFIYIQCVRRHRTLSGGGPGEILWNRRRLRVMLPWSQVSRCPRKPITTTGTLETIVAARASTRSCVFVRRRRVRFLSVSRTLYIFTCAPETKLRMNRAARSYIFYKCCLFSACGSGEGDACL